MSYGWLTESSLLPKPAKKVFVSNVGINELNSIIEEKLQERKQLKRKIEEAKVIGKETKLKDTFLRYNDNNDEEHDSTSFFCKNTTKKRKNWLEKKMEEKNEGLQERNLKDEIFVAQNKKTSKNIKQHLEEKSKIYDTLMNGNVNSLEKSKSILYCQVDFQRKISESKDYENIPVPSAASSAEIISDTEKEDKKEKEIKLNFSNEKNNKISKNNDVKHIPGGVLQSFDKCISDEKSKTFLLEFSRDIEKDKKEIGDVRKERHNKLKEKLLILRQKQNQN